jgi:uncharacterized protein
MTNHVGNIDCRGLQSYLKANFKIDFMGLHGLPHWARVFKNGEDLYAAEVARGYSPRMDVIYLFAFLHDHCREHDNEDYLHGTAAATNAAKLREQQYFEIDDMGFDLLCYAMTHHSHGQTEADITVQICWDSDRLDLGRVGVIPDPKYLCTASAKTQEMIDRAYKRSTKGKEE